MYGLQKRGEYCSIWDGLAVIIEIYHFWRKVCRLNDMSSAVKATLQLHSFGVSRRAHTRTHTHTKTHVLVRTLMSVGSRGVVRSHEVVGLQQRQREEHLRLSWHQVLGSCLNESNLPSPLPPSFTKQISFAVCSSPLIQLPQALCWAHQL